MKERPIRMRGPEVVATLEDRQTQTRRIVVPTMTAPRVAPLHMEPWIIDGEQETDDHGLPCWSGFHPDYPGEAKWFSCPWGGVGDRLWVRETFVIESNHYCTSATEYPPSFTDGRPTRWQSDDEYGDWWEQCHYRATDPEPALHYGDLSDPHCRWRPSIHMPRWASRLTMEITGVRVERLQDITPRDVVAEGLYHEPGEWGPDEAYDHLIKAFAELWDTTTTTNPAHRWAANPWIWRIVYRRIAHPPASPLA